MSDGLTESRRNEEIIKNVESALHDLEGALRYSHDQVFGVSTQLIDLMNEYLKDFGLEVIKRYS